MIIYGFRFYGRVDHVPGMFHVATRFLHLFFFPTIPLTTFLIVEGSEQDDGFQGAPIRISIKSIAIAYLRAFLVVAGVVLIIGSKTSALLFLPGILVAASGWFPAKWLVARPARAAELAIRAGISPEEMTRHQLERKHRVDGTA